MANAFPKSWSESLQDEINPTEITITNIPCHWKINHLRHLICQMKLPHPIALTYISSGFYNCPGQALAAFASWEESRRVIQTLNHIRVSGQLLSVQFKKTKSCNAGKENDPRGSDVHPAYPSPGHGVDQADSQLQTKPSTAHTPRKSIDTPSFTKKDQTPSSESYDLLLSYQTNPVEKKKLKNFLAQKGDYQEAVNEFAKNRARETQEGLHGTCIEYSTILEMRPPTPGEEEQIVEMEARFGRGGRASWSKCIKDWNGDNRNAKTRLKDIS